MSARLFAFLGIALLAFPVVSRSSAQPIDVVPAFDPRLPAIDDEGDPLGMNTHVDGVSADGRTIVGHAEELVRVDYVDHDYNPSTDAVPVLITNTIVFKWRDGVFTKLPFHYGYYRFGADPRRLGISADGLRIYGVATEGDSWMENPPVTVIGEGETGAGTFGEWVEFRPGLRARTTPVGTWIGEATNPEETVYAVSGDFSTFVGSRHTGNNFEAKIWRKDEVITIPAAHGFEHVIATGVSADGRVVCGYFYQRVDEDDEYTGDEGFVWTKETGVVFQRAMASGSGPPFDDAFPDINATAISADGGTVVGIAEGVDSSGRCFPTRQILGPSVSIHIPKEKFSVGEPIKVEVKVFSPTPETQTITFPDSLLISPDGKSDLEFAEGDDPVPTLKLTPDDPARTFTVTVTPNEFGTLELATRATAVSSKGTKDLTASETYHITPLKVTLKMKPLVDGKPLLNAKIVQANGIKRITDSEGRTVVPKVEVTVENLGATPLVGALQGVDPRARDRSAGLGRIRTSGDFPMDFPRIVKGTPIVREIDVEINEDGRFEFAALVTAREEGGTHGFNASARGAPLAVGEPYPLKMEIKMPDTQTVTKRNNGAIFVKPGGTVQFIANIENVTSNSTVRFFGINAEKNLNVLGGRLTSDEGNQTDPPFAHEHEVDANATAVLHGMVKTDLDGAPSGTIKWVGLEDIVLVDDATGDETELSMDDVLVESEVTGWLGDILTLRVIQDVSTKTPRSLDTLEIGNHISYGVLQAFGEWAYDSIDAVGGIGRLAGTIVGNPSYLADAWGEGSRVIWEMAENAERTWRGMTPAQREEFALMVGRETVRRAYLLASRSPFPPEDVQAGMTFARNATYGFFGGVESAYGSNDPAQIAEMWGQVSGRVSLEVATALMPSPKFQEYTKGAEALLQATNLRDAALITDQATLIRKLDGLVDSTVARKVWGIGGENLRNIREVFEKFKVKGYLRERSPRAFDLIDRLRVAVCKPEMMKPKGFSEIDRYISDDLSLLPRITGNQGEDLGIDGITVIFMPDDDHILTPRILDRLRADGYPEDSIGEALQACLNRAKQRREEYFEYVPKFQNWAADTAVNGGGIPVPRNYVDNGVPSPGEFLDAKRAFTFERHELPGGRSMFVPKMADAGGVQRYISGDIDWVHFSFLDGSPLDARTARKLYDAMFRSCGLQHPETISWIRDGQTVFKGKLNQIGEFLSGQKSLLEVSPTATRAVRINKELTRFANNGRDHLIFFEAGIKSRIRASLADIESGFAHALRKYPDRRLLMPFLQIAKFDEALNAAGAGEGNWTYSTAENDSLILRENSDGVFQMFNGTGWIPWPATPAPDLPDSGLHGRAMAAPSSNTVHLAPTSNLVEPAAAGSATIKVTNLPVDWPEELEGHVTNWFAAGQKIVIAPGELTQEVRFVAQAGDVLLLTQPLTHAHPANTLVAVVPGGMTIPDVPSTASPLVSTVPDELRGIVTMLWEVLPGHMYLLESAPASNPGQWSAVLPAVPANDDILNIEIPFATYQPGAHYRLRKVGNTAPVIGVSPSSLTTSAPQGSNARPTAFTVRNTGTGTLRYTALSSRSWIVVSSDQGTSTGASASHLVSFATAGLVRGTHTGNITVSAPGAANVVIPVSVTIMDPSLGNAGDNTSLTWTSTGSANWRPVTSPSKDGVDAMESGEIGHSALSRLGASIQGPATLSFWWKVSSEADCDFLRFTIDGAEVSQATAISGEVDWRRVTVPVPAGNHQLAWTYQKDSVISQGNDRAWLDQVAVAYPAAPEIAVLNGSANLSDGGAVAFGNVNRGTGRNLSLTIRNTGTATLSGIKATLAGANGSDFSVASAPRLTLLPGASTALVVRFTPNAAGSRSAGLRIASNDASENPFDLALSGNGLNVPEIAVFHGTAALLDGASVAIGSSNLGAPKSLRLTIRNAGTANLSGIRAAFAGGNTGDFAVGSAPAVTLAPGASTTLVVRFNPGAAGTRNTSLRIASNDADENLFDIRLSGTGLVPDALRPEIAVSKGTTALTDGASLGFGSVKRGSARTIGLTVKNTGSANLTGIKATVTGGKAGEFAILSPPSALLKPGASSALVVRFRPAASGRRAATLKIASNDADENSFDLAISGTGLAAPEIAVLSGRTNLSDGKSTLAFGSIASGKTKLLSLKVRNTGSAPLKGIRVTLAGKHAGDFVVVAKPGATLSPGKSANLTVRFRFPGTGARLAILRISSNDADEKVFDIRLTAKSTKPGKRKKSALVANWGMVRVGEETFRSVTIPKQIFSGREPLVEVSPDRVDWFSGPRHTLKVTDNAAYLRVRDKTPRSSGKRHIRIRWPEE